MYSQGLTCANSAASHPQTSSWVRQLRQPSPTAHTRPTSLRGIALGEGKALDEGKVVPCDARSSSNARYSTNSAQRSQAFARLCSVEPGGPLRLDRPQLGRAG